MAINKDSRTIAEQIALLKSRGMLMKDEQKVAFYLNHISYFRLKGYWWDMQTDRINLFTKCNSTPFANIRARYFETSCFTSKPTQSMVAIWNNAYTRKKTVCGNIYNDLSLRRHKSEQRNQK